MKIHKYQFPDAITGGVFKVELPFLFKILTVQEQCGIVTMWYLASGDMVHRSPRCTREFGFYTTGFDDVPYGATYMHTFQFASGQFVLHMFELQGE